MAQDESLADWWFEPQTELGDGLEGKHYFDKKMS